MRLNYSWRRRERSCKSLHLHSSASGCAAQWCTPSDGVIWGKKTHDYPCRISIPHGLAEGRARVCVLMGFTNCPFLFRFPSRPQNIIDVVDPYLNICFGFGFTHHAGRRVDSGTVFRGCRQCVKSGGRCNARRRGGKLLQCCCYAAELSGYLNVMLNPYWKDDKNCRSHVVKKLQTVRLTTSPHFCMFVGLSSNEVKLCV